MQHTKTIVQKIKTVLYITAVLAIVLFVTALSVFSRGERVGKIVKFSQKGFIFKTYEGTLQLGDQGTNLWNFTVEDDRIAEAIRTALSHQKQVKVGYKEKYFTITNDTNYEIVSVTEIGGQQ